MPGDSAPTVEDRFASVRARLREHPHVTLLHVGAQELLLVAGAGTRPDKLLSLALGMHALAQAVFHHDPPTPHELERAIDKAEDELARARSLAAQPGVLVTTDPALHALARAAGAVGPRLTREAVETSFQRLASASLGHAGAMAGLPAGREAAALLLVLRECLHHLGHASIELIDADAAAT